MLQKRGGKSSLIKLEIARKEKSMLTILNSESLWIGTDMIQFNAIRNTSWKLWRCGESYITESIQYEIFVARKDLEKAQAVMWNLLR